MRCVKAVKASYTAIVTDWATSITIRMSEKHMDLPKFFVSRRKLQLVLTGLHSSTVRKTQQNIPEHLDVSVISSIVHATLYILDDVVQPAANCVLEQ